MVLASLPYSLLLISINSRPALLRALLVGYTYTVNISCKKPTSAEEEVEAWSILLEQSSEHRAEWERQIYATGQYNASLICEYCEYGNGL
jgi:hypothetical protein